jgi:hypothetical protein
MNYGPIETVYRGYKFRSRLEARWAVFFDAVGIEWKYEPEGFEAYGERYLPDFFLPASGTWVEVKGTDDALQADHQKLCALLDHSSPLSDMENSLFHASHGLLLLGDIPEPRPGLTLHPIVQHSKGLHLRRASFWYDERPVTTVPPSWVNALFGIPDMESGLEADQALWTTRTCFCASPSYFSFVLEGYAAARAARFEHGSSG